MLWVFIVPDKNDLDSSNYNQIPMALITEKDLRESIMAALHLNSLLVFTLEKYHKKDQLKQPKEESL